MASLDTVVVKKSLLYYLCHTCLYSKVILGKSNLRC